MHVCLLFLVAALVWTTPIPALQKSEREHDLTNGMAIYRQTFTYDDGRNATRMRRYSQDGSLIHEEKYSYELDSTGNWIKRLSSRSLKNESKFEAREGTYRKTTYF